MEKLQTKMAKKTDAPKLDTKVSAPPSESSMAGMPSISDLVESTNLGSTGISEVINAKDMPTMARETITHPVILLVVVGGLLLWMGSRR
jgi:hypothetical protein